MDRHKFRLSDKMAPTREEYLSACPGENTGMHEGWIGDAQAKWLMGRDGD
jgi:hypothetical protein